MNNLLHSQETIVALATPSGIGAIGVIRLSGKQSIAIVNSVFKGKDLEKQAPNTIHFGTIRDGDKILDEVLISLFKAPHSFTKEDAIEISTHGSPYIIKQITQLLIRKGARSASPGEFTKRAFMNGQFDLAQAEAVADLIHADSEASHQSALNQLRGGFSQKIKALREQLIHFASMVELELDFGEEDVEFADRDDLRLLINNLLKVINDLIDSFSLGNAIKEGIPTVIAGQPNAGKSTLLNALLNEERAIVSEIAGTTRDVIEDELFLEGIKFRFIDTAGLRDTEDTIEKIGVERTRENIKKASLVLFMYDVNEDAKTRNATLKELELVKNSGVPFIVIGNKVDLSSEYGVQSMEYGVQSIKDEVDDRKTEGEELKDKSQETRSKKQEPRIRTSNYIEISASTGLGLEELKTKLLQTIESGQFKKLDAVVTNARHYESLLLTKEALDRVILGLNDGVSGDFLAMDIRQSLHHLGLIVGEISTDDLLENIFSRFCIGK